MSVPNDDDESWCCCCGCFEVAVDSDRFATTTSRDVVGWFFSDVINFHLETVIITSWVGFNCAGRMPAIVVAGSVTRPEVQQTLDPLACMPSRIVCPRICPSSFDAQFGLS